MYIRYNLSGKCVTFACNMLLYTYGVYNIYHLHQKQNNILKLPNASSSEKYAKNKMELNKENNKKIIKRAMDLGCDIQNHSWTHPWKPSMADMEIEEIIRRMHSGEKLDLLVGLGNGYDLTLCGERPVLMGGGAGVPPMYLLAKKLINEGKKVSVILGFNTKSEIFYENEARDDPGLQHPAGDFL